MTSESRWPWDGRFRLFHQWNNHFATKADSSQREETGGPGGGCRAAGSSHLASQTTGNAVTTHPMWDTTAGMGTTLVVQHSPGLLADQKMSLPVGGGPISAVTEAPRLDYLSRSSRPALAAATERVRLL